MKGIILAESSGTRLHPLTLAMSKQMMTGFDEPLLYYPLSTLLMSGIRDLLIILSPHDLPHFVRLLGNGENFGFRFTCAVQETPNGLAQAFVIGKSFIRSDKVALILGDNIFYGDGLSNLLQQSSDQDGGIVFVYHVSDPERYGMVEFYKNNRAISIEEKPNIPKSNYVVPDMYFCDNSVVSIAKTIKPSVRGEFEITDVNQYYLSISKLKASTLSRGTARLDTGTFFSLIQAGQYMQVIEERQGQKIGCIKEDSFRLN